MTSSVDFVTAKEKAMEWGISLRRVQTFCEQGRIEGVQRMGKIWIIPKNAKRPGDMRYSANKSDAYIAKLKKMWETPDPTFIEQFDLPVQDREGLFE